MLRWGAPKGGDDDLGDDDGAPGCTKDRRGEERRDGAMKR